MAYYLQIFSPETYKSFSGTDRTVTGVRKRQRNQASRVKPGDYFICYLTRLSRWCGLLRVEDGPFEKDDFEDVPSDAFSVQFKVAPIVWLPPEKAIPIKNNEIWNQLSITSDHDPSTNKWTIFFRSSLSDFNEADAEFLHRMLESQKDEDRIHPLNERDERALKTWSVRREEGSVAVSVPEDLDDSEDTGPKAPIRESIEIQALLARIGSELGLKVWLPASDRSAVLKTGKVSETALVRTLPLNYDDTTLDTIERIDVLWLDRRSIVRAFEVEHTTAIYSGLLRMADLLSLQPNLNIKLHIVAPEDRKDKVMEEIRRPVFSLLQPNPLAEVCGYLGYEAVREIASLPHLSRMRDDLLEDFVEHADDR